MAKKRDDYLINLLITSQNLAEGDLNNLSKELADINQQVKNLEQSEKKRTDTIRGQQRATADYSKENQKIIDQNRVAVDVNEKEIKSISDKAAAVEKQDVAFSNFFKNYENSLGKIKRDIEKQKLDIDVTGVKASLTKVEEAIINVDRALSRDLSKSQTEDLEKLKERLVLLKQSYSQEAKNIGIRKQALADEEKQVKNQESLAKARDDAEKKARAYLSVQERAKKLDEQLTDQSRKRAKATRELILLLEKEEEITARAESGNAKAVANLELWREEIKKTKRDLESYGATTEEIETIETNAARSREDRTLRLAKARFEYTKQLEREQKVTNESIDIGAKEQAELDLISEKKRDLREQITLLGGSYVDLDKKVKNSTKESEKNVGTLGKLKDFINSVRQGDDSRSPFVGFAIAFRKTSDEAATLSRKLGRLGLAVRGLAIVGILAFMQSFISVLGALGAQLVAVVGSVISAAGAIGISLVSAVAQAIPVVGLLAAAFSRIAAIQEAVGQADLARKQAFGDTGAEQAATDAALQIAEAQRGVKEAQEEVTKARKEAKKELEDLILKEREAELAFKSATLSQLEARRALREAVRSGDVEGVAREQLGVEESALDTIRARRELRDARAANRQGRRGGVQGTETYKNAVNALADAQRNLAQAQRSAASAADTQSAAQQNLGFFLSQLSEAERKLFKQFMRVRDRYKKVFRPITDIIINSFSRGLLRAEKLLFSSGIVSGFRNLSSAIANSFDRIAKVLTGPQFKSFFVEILRQAAANMPLITDGFILLAKIFRNIALAAGPAFRTILEFIVEKLLEFNNTVSDTNAFSEFLMMGVEHFKAWIDLIVSILGLMGELMQASSSSALESLTSLTDVINDAKDSLKADDSGAKSFFDDAAVAAKEMARVVAALGAALVELTASNQVKALADIFTNLLIPGMVLGIKVVGTFALGLDKIIEVPIISHLMQLGVALFFIVSAFTAVRAIFQPAVTLFIHLGRALIPLLSGFGGFSGILSSVIRGLAALGGPVGWIVVAVITAIIGAFTALKENFLGITDMMKDALGGLGDAFNNLFSAFGGKGKGGGVGSLFDGLVAILNVIIDIISFVGKLVGFVALLGVIEFIIKPLTFVVNTIADIINVWSTFINDIKNNGLGPALKNLAKNILQTIGKLTGRLLAFILRLPILIIKGVIAGVKALFNGLKKILPLAIDAVVSLAKTIWKFLTNRKAVSSSLKSVGNTIINFFKNLPNILWKILKGAGKAIWDGLVEGIGTGTAEKIVNFFIGVINTMIDAVNKIPIVPDIDKLEEVDLKEKPDAGPRSRTDAAGRGRARTGGAATSKDRTTESNKSAAKAGLENYQALNMVGGASKKNIKLNNQLADSLDRSSKQHRRAQNLQEQLNKAAARGRRQQELYSDSVRKTARVEEKYANSLARARRIKTETNERDRASVRIRERLANSTKAVSNMQSKYYSSTIRASAANLVFNKAVRTGNNLQELQIKYMNKASKASVEHRQATGKLSKRLGKLNQVLRMTGENSRALGVVFKSVTNKILTEFNVKPLKIQLPTVSGMFKGAMGDSEGFQRGGYFGNKGMRGPDDRTIMVAGGEAILTGNHQAAVDTAFSIANQTAGFPYQNLDHMFNRDKRPHASAKRFNRGGRIPGFARGGNVVLPKTIPDAMGALPGLDLMAFLLNKHFGLSVVDGIRAAGTLTSSGNISDHTWGGAIDVSNGYATPEMNAAWRWLANSIGAGGSWVENYSGGAIKQMLYKTMIGGNHFDHIHLALNENYARSTRALLAVLEGAALPAGGGMFLEAPELKKPKIKGDKGAPKNMLQGQADKLTSAANRLLKKKIQPLSGNISLRNMDSFDSINRIYAEHNSAEGDWGGPTLPFNVVAALAQAAGMPGITFAQIAKGESGMRPGATGIDPGGTKGLGLWMITTGYNDELIARFGGEAQMRNPVKNALAAKSIYDSMGTDAWYGTGFVTDFNKPYRGKIPKMPHNRGGMIPEFNDGGIVPGPIGQPRLIKAHGGETILPTHRYQTGGRVPRYQVGGMADGIPDTTTIADIRGRKSKGIVAQIRRVAKKLQNAESENRKNFFAERLKELQDMLLLSKEVKEYNKEIKALNKKIREKEKEIRKADGDKKKELQDELKDLQKELAGVKSDKKATVAFEGELYNTNNLNEFILLISDRITSFMEKIDEQVSKMAAATSRWTYKLIKVDGKQIITKTNSAVEEAVRALDDLVAETGLIDRAIAETRRGEKQARRKLKKTRTKYTKQINKAQTNLNKDQELLGKTQDEDTKKEIKERIKESKKNLDELRKNKKDDVKKLQTSIKNSNDKQRELEERRAENLAARYEQQIAIFEENVAQFDNQIASFDTQVEIATLQFTSSAGNLSTQGKEAIRNLYQQRQTALQGQGGVIQAELNRAIASGDVQRISELQQALLENKLAILQNTESINELDTALEDALAEIASRISMFDTQIEIANLQFTSSSGNLSEQGKDVIRGIYEERARALEEQRRTLQEQLDKATAEGDTTAIREIQQSLLDNQVALLQNTQSIRELNTGLQDMLEEIDSRLSMFDTQIEIANLEFTNRQGQLSDEGRAIIRGIYEQRAAALQERGTTLQEQLRLAMEEGDVIRSRELEQAILENRLALLQNTESIQELDETFQDGFFDFQSSNWQAFRQAIFSNGNILPQLQSTIPQLASGGFIRREGLAYLHAAEVVTPANKTGNKGPFVDTINFTQPMEVADPVAISNQIGFKLSTLKSL